MDKIEQRFWEYITWFGELPGILIPLSFIGGILIRSNYQIGDTINNSTLFFKELITTAIIGFGGIFLSYSIGTIIKYFYYKPRPIPRDTSTTWKRINAGSMPSIHSSNGLITAVALCNSLIILLGSNNINYHGFPYYIIIMIFGFFYYLSIALSRIALQKHYPIDILAGTLLGITISICLFLNSNGIIFMIESIFKLFI